MRMAVNLRKYNSINIGYLKRKQLSLSISNWPPIGQGSIKIPIFRITIVGVYYLYDQSLWLFSVEMSQRQFIENLNITANDVFTLKEFFKEEINSNRRFEEISTIQELIAVLEDREAFTNDVLLKLEPNFRNLVYYQRSKVVDKELILPQNVVRLICENHSNEWKTLGVNLKLTEEQLSQCKNMNDVLLSFVKNCSGVSPQEMIFRLNRGLEKCGKGELSSSIVELMGAENL